MVRQLTERGGALKDTPSDKVSSPYPIEGVEVLIQYIKDQSRPKSVETPRRRQALTQLRVLGKGTLDKIGRGLYPINFGQRDPGNCSSHSGATPVGSPDPGNAHQERERESGDGINRLQTSVTKRKITLQFVFFSRK